MGFGRKYSKWRSKMISRKELNSSKMLLSIINKPLKEQVVLKVMRIKENLNLIQSKLREICRIFRNQSFLSLKFKGKVRNLYLRECLRLCQKCLLWCSSPKLMKRNRTIDVKLAVQEMFLILTDQCWEATLMFSQQTDSGTSLLSRVEAKERME